MLKYIVLLMLATAPLNALAQESADDFDQRMALSKQMLQINPVSQQIERAVNVYVDRTMSANTSKERDILRRAILNLINDKALEKIAVDAYAETFSADELAAMVEYFSKPEAQSASAKQPLLNDKIGPEIIRMLDQALVKVRTAGEQGEEVKVK